MEYRSSVLGSGIVYLLFRRRQSLLRIDVFLLCLKAAPDLICPTLAGHYIPLTEALP